MIGILRTVAVCTVSIVLAHYAIQAVNTEMARRSR